MSHFHNVVYPKSQRWFLATKSLSQIFISKILIYEIVCESWRILAVNHEINARLCLSALCDQIRSKYAFLMLGLCRYKNQQNRHLKTTSSDLSRCGHVDGHVLNSLCIFRPTVTRNKSRFYSRLPLWRLYTVDLVNLNPPPPFPQHL